MFLFLFLFIDVTHLLFELLCMYVCYLLFPINNNNNNNYKLTTAKKVVNDTKTVAYICSFYKILHENSHFWLNVLSFCY